MAYDKRHPQGFIADHIGWRAAMDNRKEAESNARVMSQKATDFEELVRQGLAIKVVTKLPCNGIRVHYERVRA